MLSFRSERIIYNTTFPSPHFDLIFHDSVPEAKRSLKKILKKKCSYFYVSRLNVREKVFSRREKKKKEERPISIVVFYSLKTRANLHILSFRFILHEIEHNSQNENIKNKKNHFP